MLREKEIGGVRIRTRLEEDRVSAEVSTDGGQTWFPWGNTFPATMKRMTILRRIRKALK